VSVFAKEKPNWVGVSLCKGKTQLGWCQLFTKKLNETQLGWCQFFAKKETQLGWCQFFTKKKPQLG
jgi:hypothetical protein